MNTLTGRRFLHFIDEVPDHEYAKLAKPLVTPDDAKPEVRAHVHTAGFVESVPHTVVTEFDPMQHGWQVREGKHGWHAKLFSEDHGLAANGYSQTLGGAIAFAVFGMLREHHAALAMEKLVAQAGTSPDADTLNEATRKFIELGSNNEAAALVTKRYLLEL